MKIEITDEQIYNMFNMYKQKKVNKVQWSNFWKQCFEQSGCKTQKEYAEKMNVSYDAVKCWNAYQKITTKEYETWTKAGLTGKYLNKVVKNNKLLKEVRENKFSKSDFLLNEAHGLVKPLIQKRDNVSIDIINDFINTLNRIKLRQQRNL